MNLRWTDAGRAALAAKGHVGVGAVKLTHLAIGDGSGPGGAGNDSRAALRNERHRAALSGQVATGKIAARADFRPDASYGITEAGVLGTAGSSKTPALYLYWTDAGAEAAKAADGTALAIALSIEFQDSAADVTVTVGDKIVFGTVDPATESEFGSTRYATAAETDGDSRERSVTPRGLREKFGALLARLIGSAATENAVYQLVGRAGGALAVEPRTLPAATTVRKGIVELATNSEASSGSDTTRAVTPRGMSIAMSGLRAPAPADATTSRKGIVELATDAEAKAGADATRAVTPKALQSALPAGPSAATTSRQGIVELATDAEAKAGKDATRALTPKAAKAAAAGNIAALLPSGSVQAGKTYVLEGLAGGGLKLVLSSLLMLNATITATYRSYTWSEYNAELDDDEARAAINYTAGSFASPALAIPAGTWVCAFAIDPVPAFLRPNPLWSGSPLFTDRGIVSGTPAFAAWPFAGRHKATAIVRDTSRATTFAVRLDYGHHVYPGRPPNAPGGGSWSAEKSERYSVRLFAVRVA